jgi:hypothetical protein
MRKRGELVREVYAWDEDDVEEEDDVYVVKNFNGMFIGYYDAATTGDNSPSDVGWEFELDRCHEVVRREKTKVVVTYEPVEEA